MLKYSLSLLRFVKGVQNLDSFLFSVITIIRHTPRKTDTLMNTRTFTQLDEHSIPTPGCTNFKKLQLNRFLCYFPFLQYTSASCSVKTTSSFARVPDSGRRNSPVKRGLYSPVGFIVLLKVPSNGFPYSPHYHHVSC